MNFACGGHIESSGTESDAVRSDINTDCRTAVGGLGFVDGCRADGEAADGSARCIQTSGKVAVGIVDLKILKVKIPASVVVVRADIVGLLSPK